MSHNEYHPKGPGQGGGNTNSLLFPRERVQCNFCGHLLDGPKSVHGILCPLISRLVGASPGLTRNYHSARNRPLLITTTLKVDVNGGTCGLSPCALGVTGSYAGPSTEASGSRELGSSSSNTTP
jgi:hypothetical protein